VTLTDEAGVRATADGAARLEAGEGLDRAVAVRQLDVSGRAALQHNGMPARLFSRMEQRAFRNAITRTFHDGR